MDLMAGAPTNITSDVTFDYVSDVVEELLLLRQQVALLESAHAILAKNTDIFFILINAMFVFFMQCGFAFLECGAVRSKNTTNILIKNMVDVFVAGICYWAVGYSFAFGEGNSFIGHTYFFSGLNGMIPNPDYALWLWHFVFAATAATIVSGAVAERCTFEAYLVYSSLITGFIYPVVTHWAWSAKGWLLMGLDDGTISFSEYASPQEDSNVVIQVVGDCPLLQLFCNWIARRAVEV
ncbi:PREDICTED: putative ammonium transporter 1 [Priapulus caudatus]|uniref:Ammonium transporter 1 n=1 Tax=Priapulus caudatus TaxID=37621 RepID=A0ABM1DQP0_PRICU|nr:PREDICTED: putative ammonium transporter 1 [Priapulus caudatus]